MAVHHCGQQIQGTEGIRDSPKVTQVVLGGPQPRSLSLASWSWVLLAALKGGGCRGARGGDIGAAGVRGEEIRGLQGCEERMAFCPLG